MPQSLQPQGRPASLESELEQLLNRWNAENTSNTPDYILSEYMLGCLHAYNNAVKARDKWFGINPEIKFRSEDGGPVQVQGPEEKPS